MYSYEEIKPRLFDDNGQRIFLRIRDNVHNLLKASGAIRMQEAISGVGGGDSWTMLACVDRLVELREIREITQKCVAGQHRIFVSTKD
jgi:hypothetical protein